MRPTLRSVLASPALKGAAAQVLAGRDRLDRPVRWVHVGEVREVAGLLRGGELILSTGLAMTDGPGEAVSYLADLVDAGAAGLLVELGTALPEIPGPVVEEARARDFPLVALRNRVRFVEVTEQVHRAIVGEQLEQVEFARRVHETFTRLSLEEADPATIVTTTADLCGSSVVLEDLARRVVAFSALGRPAAGLLADWERRSRSAPTLDGAGISGPEGWVTAPVGLPGSRWGRLVVPDPQTDQTRLTMLLERAAQALELGRMVERHRLGLELQAQGGLLADLAAGRVEDEETARARAAALGLTVSRRYAAVVARTPGAPAGSGTALDEHDRSRDLVERLSRAVRATNVSGLVGSMPGHRAGSLLAVPPDRTDARAAEDRLLTSLVAALDDPDVVLGVGPPSTTLLGAGTALGAASHLTEVAAAMPPGEGRRPWYRNSDVRIHGLVALLHDDPRVQAFVESELGPLLDHEARTGDGLLDLLRQYVAAGGNKTRLATMAHRSRPAVYKRLARLERVLGTDLDDPVSLVSLGVAVLALDRGRATDS